MKAYKVTILVIDHDKLGLEGIKTEIENARYPNDCVSPQVKSIEEKEIGEWSDEHPLNLRATCDEEFERIFN